MSVGELAITRSISLVAVCCSRASASSSLRALFSRASLDEGAVEVNALFLLFNFLGCFVGIARIQRAPLRNPARRKVMLIKDVTVPPEARRSLSRSRANLLLYWFPTCLKAWFAGRELCAVRFG